MKKMWCKNCNVVELHTNKKRIITIKDIRGSINVLSVVMWHIIIHLISKKLYLLKLGKVKVGRFAII